MFAEIFPHRMAPNNSVMNGREQCVLEVKHEVDELQAPLGMARKYAHVKPWSGKHD